MILQSAWYGLRLLHLSVGVHGFSSCHRWILASWFMLSRHGDATEDLPELRTPGSPSG